MKADSNQRSERLPYERYTPFDFGISVSILLGLSLARPQQSRYQQPTAKPSVAERNHRQAP